MALNSRLFEAPLFSMQKNEKETATVKHEEMAPHNSPYVPPVLHWRSGLLRFVFHASIATIRKKRDRKQGGWESSLCNSSFCRTESFGILFLSLTFCHVSMGGRKYYERKCLSQEQWPLDSECLTFCSSRLSKTEQASVRFWYLIAYLTCRTRCQAQCIFPALQSKESRTEKTSCGNFWAEPSEQTRIHWTWRKKQMCH